MTIVALKSRYQWDCCSLFVSFCSCLTQPLQHICFLWVAFFLKHLFLLSIFQFLALISQPVYSLLRTVCCCGATGGRIMGECGCHSKLLEEKREGDYLALGHPPSLARALCLSDRSHHSLDLPSRLTTQWVASVGLLQPPFHGFILCVTPIPLSTKYPLHFHPQTQCFSLIPLFFRSVYSVWKTCLITVVCMNAHFQFVHNILIGITKQCKDYFYTWLRWNTAVSVNKLWQSAMEQTWKMDVKQVT